MILLKIDSLRISVREPKGDAPGTTDMDGVTNWRKTLQRMKVEARDVHFVRRFGDVQSVKTSQNACMQSRVDPSCSSSGPQVGEGLVLERLDHVP